MNSKIKVLVIGNGGREHAIAWKAAQSPLVSQVYVAPGNAGTALESNLINVEINSTDVDALVTFAKHNQIGLTIVGPEAPLVLGVVNKFNEAGLKIFGPTKKAAQLESSKSFSKEFLKRHHIPTADYQVFTEVDLAIKFIKEKGMPIVIKADGLAAGKGVIVALTFEEAKNAVNDMLGENKFGEAGHKVVIEEFLQGEEASFIVMVDGENVLPMATSQDHKRAFDNDKGPNTGGMGAYSPTPVVTNEVFEKIMTQVIYPTVEGMKKEGNPYTGFLYAGLMIDEMGNPKVIEFNCRFGDPETQPIMMRLKSDIVRMCLDAVNLNLKNTTSVWDERHAVGVVMAAGGYPDKYVTDDEILGLKHLNEKQDEHVKVFHSGTKIKDDKILTNGGRVLCVTALGDNILKAQQNAYQEVYKISWDNAFYRTDIAYRAIKRES